MKICSLYGAGFYYIPGTDTCIKVGGWVRAEMNFNGGGSFSVFKSATLDSRALDFETTRTRGIMTIDARSQTEYGTLRSYIAGGFQETNNAWTSNETYAPRAFVQWAGFTAGRAQSFFDFYATPAYSNTTNVLGSDTGGQGDTVFAYTAQFGNGFSASISAEDTTARRLIVSGSGGYAGRQWPDFAANLRLDQAWGSAQVMGAVHQVRTKSDTSPTFSEVGYALGAGVKFNLPMLGKGDSVATQFTYAKGALSYVGSGLGTFAITNGGTTANGLSDDAVVSGTAIDLTQGWSVVAGYGHHWNANWQTSLYGTYGHINYSDAAGATLWGAGQNADWSFWQVGSRTVWTPVHNLDLSVDVMYNKLDQSLTGAAFDDKGWWQGMFRVQRNFYP